MRPAHTLIALLSLSLAGAQPLITEFVAINSTSQTDGDGNTPDWIEIHNPEPTPFSIAGYHLTDDIETPQKYTFPTGTTIPAGGYLIVFASAQTIPNYSDGGGFLHTNFSLDGAGEYLALNAPGGTVLQSFAPFPPQREDISYGISNSATTSTIMAPGANSKWLVPSSNIGTSWQLSSFNDSAWTTASTGIGYGYDSSLIGTGGSTSDQMWFGNPSVYLRIPFEITDPAAISSLTLGMRFDDGFAAYLNGTRIASSNAPTEATIAFNSTATDQQAEPLVIQEFIVPPTSLVTGTNILSIQGLNFSSAAANSNDFLALPELSATSSNENGTSGYFTTPTPGAANNPTQIQGFVADTKFSHDRGYYIDPFNLTITTKTLNATIYYTTDGTPPSPSNGTLYTAPIPVNATSTIRALATRENLQPTNIDTQTYLFVDDIVRQTRPTGYPTAWAGVTADYDMDPDIVDHPAYSDLFDEAFAALPSLSLVFDPDALFHPTTGIYQNPQSQGDAWERPLSAEFMVPDSSEPGFQINAGVRVQGGSSRNPDTPKHSLSLRFRAEYGDSKLNYPLYKNSPIGETAVETFDLLQLRPEYNFGWMHRHWYQADFALYGRDQWASDMFNSMARDRIGSHGRWVHLFLNGIYWGLYDLQERPDADHMANYLGGNGSDYDTVNSSVATNGDLVAFNAMMDLAYSTIQTQTTLDAIQQYLDLDAFADYMILNAYIGNRDWDGHNWRAGRKREPGAPYLFFPWDSEFAASHVGGGVFTNPPNFFTTALSTNVTGNNGNRRPTGLQTRLQLNAEYRLRYADRVRAHFFNGGPLSPEISSALWTNRSAAMTEAIVAESARWGDHRRDLNSGNWSSANFDLYTRDDHYLPTHDWLVGTYIPQRTDIVLAQLRARSLYPATDAPDFSTHGGTIPRGLAINVSAPATIRYTTDGSDPRLTGGTINPTAITIAPGGSITLNQSTLLKARTQAANGEWSALTEATFTVDATELQISEIMYQPIGNALAEFLELTNTGEFEISLTGLHFTQGITFDFDQHSSIATLAPGARLLIVRDLAVFQATYGNSLNALIAGTFQEGSALNNGGEALTISDASGSPVLIVSYRDTAPWPTEADTLDHSLVFSGADPALAQNWRASTTPGGNPGTTDTVPFIDGDLLDYALVNTAFSSDYTQLTWTTKLAADDVTYLPQHSANLNTWTDLTTTILTQTINATEGTRTFTIALPTGTTGYGRVRVLQR